MSTCGYIIPPYTMGSPLYYIHPSCYPVWDGNYTWNLTTTPGVNWAINGYNVIESIINANALGTGLLVNGSTGQVSKTPVITGGVVPTIPTTPITPPFLLPPGIPGPVQPQVTPQTFGSPGFTNGPIANAGSMGAAGPMLGQTEQFLASLPPELTGGGSGMGGAMGGTSSINQMMGSAINGVEGKVSSMLQQKGLSLNSGAQPVAGMASAAPQPARANAGGMPQMDPGMAMMMFMAFLQAMIQFMPFLQQMMQQQQGQAQPGQARTLG